MYQIILHKNSDGYLPSGMDVEVKRIGTYIGENGGTERMERVVQMVNAIDNQQGHYCAAYRYVSSLWNHICGWYP